MIRNNIKNYSILLALCVLVCATVNAQETGIQFQQGSWNDILERARKEDKAIFIDVYTEWCGPCKKMAADIFPQEKVGVVLNAAFINYKIDAEKGEGIELSGKYNARAYPTYLFINNKGELIYRTTGFMQAEAFIKEAKIAIAEKNDPKPLAWWTDEYLSGQRNKEFLFGYLKKRQAIQLPSAILIDELFSQLSKDDLQQKESWSSLLSTSVSTEYVAGGKLYRYIVSHHKSIDSITNSKNKSLPVLQLGMHNYILRTLVPEKKEAELPTAELAMKQLGSLLKIADSATIWRRVRFDYYSKNYNPASFNAAATRYVEQGLFKRDPYKMIADNKPAFDKFMEPYLSGQSDSMQVDNWVMTKHITRMGNAVIWSFMLRDVAEAIYLHSTEKKVLQKGLTWAKKSRDAFPHWSTDAVCAGMLFKNGKQAEALQLFESALAKAPSTKTALFAENVTALKAGKAPKSLWK